MILKRIYNLLQPEERKKACRMAVTVFFTALLDFIGLASLLPLLYFLLDDSGNRHAALLFSLLAISVIIVKNILIILFTRYQNKCLLSFYKRLSFSLFSSYYSRGLLFIREHGSNKLGHEINIMCYAFSNSLLAPLCRMTADILLIIFMTAALLIFDGATVLILYVSFIPFMCLYFFFVRKLVRKYGDDDMRAKREQSRIVMDTFTGYAELEVNGAFRAMQTLFLEGMEKISNTRIRLDTVMRLPLFLAELSVVIGLALLLVFGSGDIKMLAGLFAVAALRLLPALRTILIGWTQVQNASCCLDTIEEGMKGYGDFDTDDGREISFEKEIRIKRLNFSYPDGRVVLKDFDCIIRKGEYVGFCGSSGVGKTTLFNILIGLLKPGSGEIWIDDDLLSEPVRKSWMKMIGYVPQDVFICNGTLAENIALGCSGIDYSRIERILEQVCLDKWAGSLPEGLNTLMSEAGGKISGGQKQRIGMARALYKQADVLLMDEATSALDNETEREINATLSNLRNVYKDLTILSIAHRDSSLAYCDRIITIENWYE